MSDQRFPIDLIVTAEDLDIPELELLLPSDDDGYSSYHSSLSKAAREAIDNGEKSKGKCLWLLADACSMCLDSESRNNPFRPYLVLEGKRSAIPEDFAGNDLGFFESVLGVTTNLRLKARLADLLWLLKKPRQVQHALTAIEAYGQLPMDHDSLLKGGREMFKRAIKLSLIIKQPANELLLTIETSLLDAFEKSMLSEGYRALWLADLLILTRIEDEKSAAIAARLESLSEEATAINDHYKCRNFLIGARDWHQRLKNPNDSYRLTVAIAETWVAEAEIRSADSNMVAGGFYEDAIKEYRRIPVKDRAPYKADERIKELHEKMTQANQMALGEMGTFETEGVDITDQVKAVQKNISGRGFPEVLIALAGIHSSIKAGEMREMAEEGMKHTVLTNLITATHMTSDGRVAARTPGFSPGDKDPSAYEQTVWREMIRTYNMIIGMITQSNILPALQITTLEHRITEQTLLELCRAASVVPPDRELLWAKGLYFGFENDFITATHMLIPQLEHLVRTALKQAGAKTSTLNTEGIETENGLKTLLENPEAEKVLGADFLFECKALLTDAIGSNLRNEVAHGLVDDNDLFGLHAVYIWWICLRLMVKSVPWRGPEKPSTKKQPDTPEAE
jgi:hypothetical protein